MKLRKSSINEIEFYYRPGTSDKKAFEEVIGRDVYQKKGISINKGELWHDCGGNVGAFALLAISRGAEVITYEPDPLNCEMIERNLDLNGFKAEVKKFGLVGGQAGEMNLYVGNNGNVWRNSLYKNWNGKGLKVKTENFDENIPDKANVKIDIEGAEMDILENTKRVFNKFVFEWSFDIDPSLPRFWEVVEKLKEKHEVASFGNAARFETRDYNTWQKSWFPACLNVYGYAKH